MSDVKLTAKEINSRRTPKGGWSRATLAEWGVPWPPPKGWRKALLEHGAPYRAAPRKPIGEIEQAMAILRSGEATKSQQVRAADLLERLANNISNDAWLCQAYQQLLKEAGLAPGSADLIAAHRRIDSDGTQ